MTRIKQRYPPNTRLRTATARQAPKDAKFLGVSFLASFSVVSASSRWHRHLADFFRSKAGVLSGPLPFDHPRYPRNPRFNKAERMGGDSNPWCLAAHTLS